MLEMLSQAARETIRSRPPRLAALAYTGRARTNSTTWQHLLGPVGQPAIARTDRTYTFYSSLIVLDLPIRGRIPLSRPLPGNGSRAHELWRRWGGGQPRGSAVQWVRLARPAAASSCTNAGAGASTATAGGSITDARGPLARSRGEKNRFAARLRTCLRGRL